MEDYKSLKDSMISCSVYVRKNIDNLLPEGKFNDSRLVDSMRYSALSDGKMIRPFLFISCAKMFGISIHSCLNIATAIEFIHVYSLIHDDLPAMDDDDYRRGKLANHKKYDEATAILAGDALLTYAFEILSMPESHQDSSIRCELIKTITKSIGFRGMAGGQMIDIEQSDKIISKDEIAKLHRLKTGELFMASAECGAIVGRANLAQRKAIRNYARDLGLAFQIKDDILDYEGNDNQINIDENNHAKFDNSASIIDVIGNSAAKKQLILLTNQAVGHLSIFEESKTKQLISLVNFVIDRKS